MTLVRAGLITADLEITADGAVLRAPLAFDGETVLEEGARRLACDPADGDALALEIEDFYLEHFAGWAARAEAQAAPVPPRGPGLTPHQPCPALWAGR